MKKDYRLVDIIISLESNLHWILWLDNKPEHQINQNIDKTKSACETKIPQTATKSKTAIFNIKVKVTSSLTLM